jgi:hypothetical protein
MRARLCLFLLLTLIFINFNCKNKETPAKEKPKPVELIPGSPDTSRIETGIDAIPDGDKIHLEWNSKSDETTLIYEVYRGSVKDGTFSKVASVSVPTRFYDDPERSVNVRYYYYVLAVSDEGVKSEPSDTLSYKLINKPEGLMPGGNSSAVIPTFRWRDVNHANDYIIRIQESGSEAFVWFSKFMAQFGSDEQSILFNADHTAVSDSLTRGKNYQWRIDIIGNEKACGSESQWISITIQ